MKNSIIILGRGMSLRRLSEFDDKNIDTVIIVNSFWDTLQCPIPYYKDPLIHNFIKDKKIYLIFTPYQDLSKINIFIEKYNVVAIHWELFSKKIRVGRNMGNIKILPDILIEPFIYVNKNFKNTGSMGVAILYAIKCLNINNFHIFGLDFYEKDYYLTNTHNYESEKSKSDLIKQQFINFIKYYNNINFNIYTLANIKSYSNDPDLKNAIFH
tara:strand:+ start:308 stop:943 length:636 start_codon:yes stop_codon:yes gene_type:complete